MPYPRKKLKFFRNKKTVFCDLFSKFPRGDTRGTLYFLKRYRFLALEESVGFRMWKEIELSRCTSIRTFLSLLESSE